jgi:hypothetical protein
VKISIYNPDYKEAWDSFIRTSKNGTFMLERDYMDYHADRFTDFSLMFFEKDKLVAVMPASVHGSDLCSHGGLTYGGIISDLRMTVSKMLECFSEMTAFLRGNNIKKVIYKCIPRIYHTYPADEDLYALLINEAKLIRRDISSVIYMQDRINFNERRRRNIKKAHKNNLLFRQTDDFKEYIRILTNVLEGKHKTKPVHNAEEITKLANSFPENIKLYCSYDKEDMLAGVLIFETRTVAHSQYIANDEEGREKGALDFVFDKLINEIYDNKTYFSFGISNEDNGKYLNTGLVTQKQEFGGRGIACDFYEIDID